MVKAAAAADALVDALRREYAKTSSQKLFAQQRTFDVLVELEHRGYDMSQYFGKVCDILQVNDSE